MTLHELVGIWFPVAQEIQQTNGRQMTSNIIRVLNGIR
jgi:hypothetical protein